ncbi:putative Holliday junction resolvase [Bradyrhizobium macuxiense]|uniref:Putative pre-16S rRNA nuclease n=2 Tax=Bradyrhizobium macuxiense TaxID=1755647 RepID=A0A560MC54_9BRAD|nr:putative Holliday junction resolvase [Bradyrhizobium macuxiense]
MERSAIRDDFAAARFPDFAEPVIGRAFARPVGSIRATFPCLTRAKRKAMPALILPLIEAAPHWPDRGALVGLDLGTKTIGVAVSDPDRRLATGVETIQRKQFKVDAARLLAIAAERNAAGFVLGLPINMDGSEGPRAQSTRAFARNLSNLTALAIGLWDERLSTAAVERELIGMDVSRARRAEVIDEHAAIFILQGALDRLAKLRGDR